MKLCLLFFFIDFSQGQPYPQQDQNAIDAVIQFAIHVLGFQPDEILLFGWSIGGYSSLVGAVQYPDVKGVVRILENKFTEKCCEIIFQYFVRFFSGSRCNI